MNDILIEVARLERERRIKVHQERDRQKKVTQRRNYIVGELFCQYFPIVNTLPPGTKAENEITFRPLIQFLEALSSDAGIKSVFQVYLQAVDNHQTDCEPNV